MVALQYHAVASEGNAFQNIRWNELLTPNRRVADKVGIFFRYYTLPQSRSGIITAGFSTQAPCRSKMMKMMDNSCSTFSWVQSGSSFSRSTLSYYVYLGTDIRSHKANLKIDNAKIELEMVALILSYLILSDPSDERAIPYHP